MELSPRTRWKLDRLKEKISGVFGNKPEDSRPKLCPACGTLVGANATRCHQCGASMTFSLAAASKSLGKLMPATSPATYGILTLSCIMYGFSFLWTVRVSGLQTPPATISGLFNFGAINAGILDRLGASRPLLYDLFAPWRFVTAVFLHGSLIHLAFNMWVLMDVGPLVEELYGSARFFFIYVITGVAGFVLSGFFGNFSVGGSGAILGICGVLLAVTAGRRGAVEQMIRANVIRLLIYVAIIGFLPLGSFIGGVDNSAHIGGFAAGFLLGKVMIDRAPIAPEERKRAYVLGWASALVVIASFAAMAFWSLHAG